MKEKRREETLQEIRGLFTSAQPWLSNLIVTEASVRRGVILMQDGSANGVCYLIRSGRARVMLEGRFVETLGPGDFVGEVPLPGRPPLGGIVTAESPMQLLVLSASELKVLLDRAPLIASNVIRVISDGLRDAPRLESPREAQLASGDEKGESRSKMVSGQRISVGMTQSYVWIKS